MIFGFGNSKPNVYHYAEWREPPQNPLPKSMSVARYLWAGIRFHTSRSHLSFHLQNASGYWYSTHHCFDFRCASFCILRFRDLWGSLLHITSLICGVACVVHEFWEYSTCDPCEHQLLAIDDCTLLHSNCWYYKFALWPFNDSTHWPSQIVHRSTVTRDTNSTHAL